MADHNNNNNNNNIGRRLKGEEIVENPELTSKLINTQAERYTNHQFRIIDLQRALQLCTVCSVHRVHEQQ